MDLRRRKLRARSGRWPFDWRICNLWVTCDVLTCSASIWHMCFISVGRYLGIRNPLHARQRNLFVSRRAVLWRIGIAWFLSAGIASPITMMSLDDPKNIVPTPTECAISNRSFMIYGSLIAFFIPMFVMVPSYVMTVRLLSQRAKYVRNDSLMLASQQQQHQQHQNGGASHFRSVVVAALNQTANHAGANHSEQSFKAEAARRRSDERRQHEEEEEEEDEEEEEEDEEEEEEEGEPDEEASRSLMRAGQRARQRATARPAERAPRLTNIKTKEESEKSFRQKQFWRGLLVDATSEEAPLAPKTSQACTRSSPLDGDALKCRFIDDDDDDDDGERDDNAAARTTVSLALRHSDTSKSHDFLLGQFASVKREREREPSGAAISRSIADCLACRASESAAANSSWPPAAIIERDFLPVAGARAPLAERLDLMGCAKLDGVAEMGPLARAGLHSKANTDTSLPATNELADMSAPEPLRARHSKQPVRQEQGERQHCNTRNCASANFATFRQMNSSADGHHDDDDDDKLGPRTRAASSSGPVETPDARRKRARGCCRRCCPQAGRPEPSVLERRAGEDRAHSDQSAASSRGKSSSAAQVGRPALEAPHESARQWAPGGSHDQLNALIGDHSCAVMNHEREPESKSKCAVACGASHKHRHKHHRHRHRHHQGHSSSACTCAPTASGAGADHHKHSSQRHHRRRHHHCRHHHQHHRRHRKQEEAAAEGGAVGEVGEGRRVGRELTSGKPEGEPAEEDLDTWISSRNMRQPALDQNNNNNNRSSSNNATANRPSSATRHSPLLEAAGLSQTPPPAAAAASNDKQWAMMNKFAQRQRVARCATTTMSRHNSSCKSQSQEEDCLLASGQGGPTLVRAGVQNHEPPRGASRVVDAPDEPDCNQRQEQQPQRSSAGSQSTNKSNEDRGHAQDYHSSGNSNNNNNNKSGASKSMHAHQEPRMIRYLGSSMQVRSEQKATRVLGLVFFAFVFCWTPFFVVNFLSGLLEPEQLSLWISDKAMSVFLWLGYISSTINPVIYTVFNRNFRRAFRRILLCREPVGRRQYRQSRSSEYQRSFRFSKYRSSNVQSQQQQYQNHMRHNQHQVSLANKSRLPSRGTSQGQSQKELRSMCESNSVSKHSNNVAPIRQGLMLTIAREPHSSDTGARLGPTREHERVASNKENLKAL